MKEGQAEHTLDAIKPKINNISDDKEQRYIEVVPAVDRNVEQQQQQHHLHKQTRIQMLLNMQNLDPDWSFAQKHGAATRPNGSAGEQYEECICCLHRVSKIPLPLCQNSKELEFLGYGYPLYFIFLKYVMIFLVLHMLNYSISEIYFAIQTNYDFCLLGNPLLVGGQEITCSSFMILIANIREESTTIKKIVRTTDFVALLLFLIYLRNIFTKTWKYYVQRKPSYATYSVLIENIPLKKYLPIDDITIGQRIRNFFEDQEIFPFQPQVSVINLMGQLDLFFSLQNRKKQILVDLGHLKYWNICFQDSLTGKRRSQHDQYNQLVRDLENRVKSIKHEMSQIDDKIKQEKKRLKRLIEQDNLNCGNAIVCFETEQDKKDVLSTKVTKQQFHRHFSNKANNIQIIQAPEPHEVAWEMIVMLAATKKKRRFLSWIIFVTLMALLTVGIYFLFTFVVHQTEKQDQNKMLQTIIIFGYLLGIVGFNKFILTTIIHRLVIFEMHKTGEKAQFSFMLKYSLGLFFTTAVMTLLVEGIINANIYQRDYGVVEEQTIMFMFQAFLVPLIWLINPDYLWKLYRRKKYYKNPCITQEAANKLMEDPPYIMGKRYGEILQGLWFMFLYSSIIPIGVFLTFIGLCFYYWVDKYNLLRRSSICQGVSGNLCMKALFMLEFVLIIKPGGELIFNHLTHQHFSIMPVIQIIVGILYLLLPMDELLQAVHGQKFLMTQMTYQEMQSTNILNYRLFNPLTKEDELIKHFEKIQRSESSPVKGYVNYGSNIAVDRRENRKYSFIRPSNRAINQRVKKKSIKEIQLLTNTVSDDIINESL